MELLAEGVVGGIGGLVGRTAAFPLDTLKVKLATSEAGTSLKEVLRKVLFEEGIFGLYRGLPFSAFEGMYQKALYVLFYASFKRGYLRLTNSRRLKLFASLTCGYVSDLCCVPFSMPIEAMVVRLQSAAPGASRANIIREGLLTWSGLVAAWRSGTSYLVLSWKPGVEFALFDRAKSMIVNRRPVEERHGHVDLPAHTAFGLGAIARGVATCVVYPYARAKAIVQAQKAPDALAAVRQVLANEGVAALYKGLVVELLRGVTQAAVMFMVMERVRHAVRLWVLGEDRCEKRNRSRRSPAASQVLPAGYKGYKGIIGEDRKLDAWGRQHSI